MRHSKTTVFAVSTSTDGKGVLEYGTLKATIQENTPRGEVVEIQIVNRRGEDIFISGHETIRNLHSALSEALAVAKNNIASMSVGWDKEELNTNS